MIRARWFYLLIVAVMLLTAAPTLAARESHAASAASGSAPGGLPLFIENVGQWPEAVRYQVYGAGDTLWLGEEALWLSVIRPVGKGRADALRLDLRLTFPGANPHARLEPFDRRETVASYYLGDDPARWRPHAPVWGRVRYRDLYPGVDLEIGGAGGRWHWRLVDRAGKGLDLTALLPQVEGATQMTLDATGRLRLTTPLGVVTLPPLTGVASPASARATGDSDLVYSTFLGGDNEDSGMGIAIDADGSLWMVGTSDSTNFTPVGAYPSVSSADYDAFVARLNAGGTALIYINFFGGSAYDFGTSIALAAGSVYYITGSTGSADLPTTAGAYDRTFNGVGDLFLAKFALLASGLVYCTYLGGGENEWAAGLALGDDGAAYVAGGTYSSNYPTTAAAYDRTFGGMGDAFIIKLNASGSALIYSTFLGGADFDGAIALAADSAGRAYVAGVTLSSDFPTTAGAYDRTLGGYTDLFVAKLSADGGTLAYATFLGGSADEGVEDINGGLVLDDSGAAYVACVTYSSDFPTTLGAYDRTLSGEADAFLAKLTPAGDGLAYATLLGGRGFEIANGLAINASREVYLTGLTTSDDFPTTPGSFGAYGGDNDAFVARFSADGSALTYSCYLGGSSTDSGLAIAVDAGQNV